LNHKRIVFVGNRRFVLEELLLQRADITNVIVIAGTHLERDLQSNVIVPPIGYRVVKSKVELLSLLNHLSFDVLVSNGCPYILPIAELPDARYVNIHPSCLPDLRGVDPVIGSILYGRDAGATCHSMDAGIDTGAVISQIRIPFTKDLDVTTLYQLSFIAEKAAIREALTRNFQSRHAQKDLENIMYYSRKSEDRIITFRESNDEIIRKIKAFNNISQGSEFSINNRRILVYAATRMQNPFLIDYVKTFSEGEIAMSYEDCIVFRKDGETFRFQNVTTDDGVPLPVGAQLF